MKKLEELIRPHLLNLKPYSSARDEFDMPADIWLDANESPFNNGVNRYPDPYQNTLKSAIARDRGVYENNIFIGNGSDEAIDLLFRAFCEPFQDEVIITPPTYGMYAVSADINAVKCIEAPLNEDFSLTPKKVLEKVTENTKIIFLCSPNNPTGNIMNPVAVQAILEGFVGLVVLDEAYIDFSENKTWINSLSKYSNLIVIQTFSKSYSGAGLRVGMLFAQSEIIDILNKIKPPYNVNGLSQERALELINNQENFQNTLTDLKKEKEVLFKALNQLDFVLRIYPSDANFWLIKVKDAKLLYSYLAVQGIVVRNRSAQLNCENTLRISIGTREENKKLIAALKNYKP